jgi:hypothetical protein
MQRITSSFNACDLLVYSVSIQSGFRARNRRSCMSLLCAKGSSYNYIIKMVELNAKF